MLPPDSTGRHRRRRDEFPGRATLLAIVATLAVLFGSGAAVTLTAVQKPEPPAGIGALAPAPSPSVTTVPEQSTSGSQAVSPSPLATRETQNSDRSGAERSAEAEETTDQVTALEDQVTALTNAERVAAGCGELRTDERLRTAARAHSQDMADHDYFSHTSLDGSSPTDRARAAGYDGGVAENIAMGYRTPEDVMQGWMNSEGHRNNLLNCSHAVIGVGLGYDDRGRPYWTQNFGRG